MATLRVRIPWAGGALEAEWRDGSRGGAVVAPPHPEYGGSLDHPVVQQLAEALATAGHATVAFNWRGVGGSDGTVTGDLAAAVADYRAAAAFLTERRPGPWCASGYSFGAATALRLAAGEPAIASLLLVAPPVAMTGTDDLAACTRPMGVVGAEHDDFAPAAVLRATLDGAPHAQLEILDGADHFFMTTPPAAVDAAIARVLPEPA